MKKFQIILLVVLIILVALNGVVLFILLGQLQTTPPDGLVCISEGGTGTLCFSDETEAAHLLGEKVSNYRGDFIYVALVEIDGKSTHIGLWVEIAKEKR